MTRTSRSKRRKGLFGALPQTPLLSLKERSKEVLMGENKEMVFQD
jgi:hypothetical protein